MIRWTCASILGATLILALGCGVSEDPWKGDEGKTRVVATIAPLESFARAVGGDRVAVRCLCTTTGPHHYQPDTRDARLLGKADLFLAVGLTLDESFARPMVQSSRRKDLRFVELGEQLPEASRLEMVHDCCRHAEPGHAHHHHDKWDPHVWLGIPQAVQLVEQIRDQLTEIDPAGKETYAANATAYVAKLHALHAEGKKLLADRPVRRIVSFHEALGYLAKSFDLEIADVIEQGPGDEPTQGHLRDLIKACKDPNKPVALIAVEPQYAGSSSAKIVHDELKNKGVVVPLATVDPLETAEASDLAREGGDWYLIRMRQNLESLAQALPAKK
jgi:ABC-type Zn uptake system ZnuABC Zn-binding protein ZnuA